MSRYKTYNTRFDMPPPLPQHPTYLEYIQDLLDYYLGLELWVFASIVVLATLVGRYGFQALLMAPITFSLWLFQSIRNFRFKPFIVIVGETADNLTSQAADKVLLKASAADRQQQQQQPAAPEQQPDAVDAVDPLAAPPNAPQRAGLRQRAQPRINDGSI